ncbi:MAG: metallophosphoesterase family protein [Planctomycetota bacterium]
MRVGIISDTHDLLRPEVAEALVGVERILHIGDVCNGSILEELGKIAPTDCVLGNCDAGPWTKGIPLTDTYPIGDILVHSCHIRQNLDLDPVAAGVKLVLYGHTHDPSMDEIDGVTYFNPGSAGPRRFSLPISIGFMEIEGSKFELRWKHFDLS